MIENPTALSAALRTVRDDPDHGRGTSGALLKEPTIYPPPQDRPRGT
jgi:hypothetical protein